MAEMHPGDIEGYEEATVKGRRSRNEIGKRAAFHSSLFIRVSKVRFYKILGSGEIFKMSYCQMLCMEN